MLVASASGVLSSSVLDSGFRSKSLWFGVFGIMAAKTQSKHKTLNRDQTLEPRP
jgi:hypothetical protein